VWHSTANNLMKNFRDSLIALLTVFEEAHIGWREENQDEEFVSIVEQLFDGIVLSKLEKKIMNMQEEPAKLPKYGFFHRNYKDMSFVEIITGQEKPTGIYVFNFISTDKRPFDTVNCVKIDKTGKIIQKEVAFDFVDVSFRFQYRMPNGELFAFSDISIADQ
jgi:hypothetical protein